VRVGRGGTSTFTLGSVPGALQVVRTGPRVTVTGEGPLLAHVGAALVAHGHAPTDLQVRRASLEDVFLQITGGRA